MCHGIQSESVLLYHVTRNVTTTSNLHVIFLEILEIITCVLFFKSRASENSLNTLITVYRQVLVLPDIYVLKLLRTYENK